MVTVNTGRIAESQVAEHLQATGYEILDRNWRTKVCEIDIVAKNGRTVYMVEVKYRRGDQQGEGFDYITQSKLKRMAFSAEVWVQSHSWEGDYRLLVASVDGKSGGITLLPVE